MLARDALAAPDRSKSPKDSIFGYAASGKETRRLPSVASGQSQQEMLCTGIFVTHLPGGLLGLLKNTGQIPRHANLCRRATNLRFLLQLALKGQSHLAGAGLKLLNNLRHNAVRLSQECKQQMPWLNLAVAVFAGQGLRLHHSFLCFLRKLI